jgi:hypothetical protein
MRIRWFLGVSGMLLSTACGGTTTVQPREPGPAGGQSANVPPSQLGHYASADGFVSLVLDRTGDKPKLRIDKTSGVVELFAEEAKERGDLAGTWLNGADGRPILFLGKDGGVWFIKPASRKDVSVRDVTTVGVALGRDAGAEALGAPTEKGIATPPAAETAWDRAVKQLTALSVMTKLPQLKPEDSGNLAKVEAALGAADAAMLVRVSAKGAAEARWAPASAFIGDTQQGLGGPMGGFPSDASWDKNGKGLAKHGGSLEANVTFGDPSRLQVRELKGWPPALQAGTPGMIWMLSSSTVVFVSFDGGRYELALASDPEREGLPVDMGGGSPASWPAPIQHSLIDIDSIRGFAKGGAIPEQTGKDIEALSDGWFECVKKAWAEGSKESEKTEASADPPDKKQGALGSLAKKYEAKARKDCEPAKKKLEEGVVKFIEARAKDRLALFDKAKARAAQLGLK